MNTGLETLFKIKARGGNAGAVAAKLIEDHKKELGYELLRKQPKARGLEQN